MQGKKRKEKSGGGGNKAWKQDKGCKAEPRKKLRNVSHKKP